MIFMKNRRKFFVIIFYVLALVLKTSAHIYILDVNDTLVSLNQKAVLSGYSFGERLKGCFSALKFVARGGKAYLKTCYFNELYATGNCGPCTAYYKNLGYTACADDGITPLPPLLTESLLGNITYDQLKKLWYATEHDNIFNKTFEFTFDPARYVASLQPMPTIKIMQLCAQEKDELGRPQNHFILLSNFSAEAAQEFRKKFKDTIMSFVGCDENCIFSGECHHCKPGYKICDICYERIMQIMKLHPEQQNQCVFFFDDQDVNCKALKNRLSQYFGTDQLICAHPKDMPKVLTENNALPANVSPLDLVY